MFHVILKTCKVESLTPPDVQRKEPQLNVAQRFAGGLTAGAGTAGNVCVCQSKAPALVPASRQHPVSVTCVNAGVCRICRICLSASWE